MVNLRRAVVVAFVPFVLGAVFFAGVSGGWFGRAVHGSHDMSSRQAAAAGALCAVLSACIIAGLAIVARVRRTSTVLVVGCGASLVAMFSITVADVIVLFLPVLYLDMGTTTLVWLGFYLRQPKADKPLQE